MFQIPILLICFNRPDHVRQVLGEIRKQQPAQLFIAQDGPREDSPTDKERILQVRAVVQELVDWPCQLHTCYQEHNLGCGPGPVAGIDWFFSQVDMGIVMEDDCLPHPDFFGYCQELLVKYHPQGNRDGSVGFISSTLYHDRWHCQASYGFSHYMVTGAWASWRSVWQGFDIDLHKVNACRFFRHVKKLTQNRQEAVWWYYALRQIKGDKQKKSYWDYQMQIHLFRHSMLTIHPQRNLVSNIGFDAEGTHTLGNDGRGNKQTYPILPLSHPQQMQVDLDLDKFCFAKDFNEGFKRDLRRNFYYYCIYSHGLLNLLLRCYKKITGKTINVNHI